MCFTSCSCVVFVISIIPYLQKQIKKFAAVFHIFMCKNEEQVISCSSSHFLIIPPRIPQLSQFILKFLATHTSALLQVPHQTKTFCSSFKLPNSVLCVLWFDILICLVVPIFTECTALIFISIQFKSCHHNLPSPKKAFYFIENIPCSICYSRYNRLCS